MMRPVVVTLLLAFAALPSSSQTREVSLSKSGMTVYVEARGNIVVTGSSGRLLVATLDRTDRELAEEKRQREPYGARVSGDRAFVWSDLPGDLTLTIPRGSRLRARSLRWGDVEVRDVCGDVEATSHEGGVRLTRLGGSIVAHAGHGPVVASLDWDRAKPTSFTSMHGAITIAVPAGLGLGARLRTDEGRISSVVPWEEALKRSAANGPGSTTEMPHLFAYTRFGSISITHTRGDSAENCDATR